MIFKIVRSQSHMTGETTTATISPLPFATKKPVALATLSPSLRLLKLDSSLSTEKMFPKSHHRCFLIATIWMRAVKVDGHISIRTSPSMDTSFLRSVLHIRHPLPVHPAVSTVLVPQSLKSRELTISEVLTVKHPKREWWRRSLETVHSTPSSRLQTFSHPIRTVFCPLMDSKTFKRWLERVADQKLQQPMLMMQLWMMRVEPGKTSTIVSLLLDGVRTPATNGGSSETPMVQAGAKMVTSSSEEAATISVSNPSRSLSMLNSCHDDTKRQKSPT